MTARAPVAKDREALRELARGLVAVARERGLERLVAETEVDGAFVRVTIERTKVKGHNGWEPDAAQRKAGAKPRAAVPDRWEEDVDVRSGPRTQPRVIFAAPAAWLEGTEAGS